MNTNFDSANLELMETQGNMSIYRGISDSSGTYHVYKEDHNIVSTTNCVEAFSEFLRCCN